MQIPMTVMSSKVQIPMTIDTVIQVISAQPYEGAYEVTPQAFVDQILPTDGLQMQDDVTVFEIPYYETSNPSGKTVFIG